MDLSAISEPPFQFIQLIRINFPEFQFLLFAFYELVHTHDDALLLIHLFLVAVSSLGNLFPEEPFLSRRNSAAKILNRYIFRAACHPAYKLPSLPSRTI